MVQRARHRMPMVIVARMAANPAQTWQIEHVSIMVRAPIRM